ncbi:MAG: hypothetical protein JKX79_01725, partial [Labilibaculum sp.]|nr:hypothetical protein [Labilibaculum sp.]
LLFLPYGKINNYPASQDTNSALCQEHRDLMPFFLKKKTDDLNELFLWLWFWGEVFTLCYIFIDDLASKNYHIPLYFNYVFNLILLFYLIYAKYTYNSKPTTLSLIRKKLSSF